MGERRRLPFVEVSRRPVLLLDLDGVVVHECGRDGAGDREILILHRDLKASLANAVRHTFVVTHRSRREATRICEVAGLEAGGSMSLIAAEDLLREACARLRVRELARFGLRKTFALSIAERLAGAGPDDLVVVDDRQQNLDPLLAAGIGLAMKAPPVGWLDRGTLLTFDLAEALESLPAWYGGRASRRQIDLPPIDRALEPWQQSGRSTVSLNNHLFNRARRIARGLRTGRPNR